MPNLLTDIREAVEIVFAPMASVVSKLITYDKPHAINFNDPTLNLRQWLVVLPAGGASDSKWSSSRVSLTRKFFVGFNNPTGDMDFGKLEVVEVAALGCIADGAQSLIDINFVNNVRWATGDYKLFRKEDKQTETGGPPMWTSFATVEVDAIVPTSEVASWKP